MTTHVAAERHVVLIRDRGARRARTSELRGGEAHGASVVDVPVRVSIGEGVTACHDT